MRKMRIIIGTTLIVSGFLVLLYSTNNTNNLGAQFDQTQWELEKRNTAFGGAVNQVPAKHRQTVQRLLDDGGIPDGVTRADLEEILQYVTEPTWRRRLENWIAYMNDYHLP